VQGEFERVDSKKACPFCSEMIKATARKCKHCGEWLDEIKAGLGPAASTFTPSTGNAQDSTLTSAELRDLLSGLVDRSLVVLDESTGRYRLLESVRQYAEEHLPASPDAERLRNQHFRYFLTFAEAAAPHLFEGEQLQWLVSLDSDYDNMRSALNWSLHLPDEGRSSLRMGNALWKYWDMRILRTEGRTLLSAILDGPAGSREESETATAILNAGVLAWYQGDYETATAYAERSLALFRPLGDQAGVARALNMRGNIYNAVSDAEAADGCMREALAIQRELGNQRGVAVALNNLGTQAFVLGELATARDYLAESLAISRERGDRWSIAIATVNLGELECEMANLEQSRSYFSECLQMTRELGWPGNPFLLEGLALVAFAEGRWEVAARLFGAAGGHREEVEMPLTQIERKRLEPKIEAVRAALSADGRFEIALQEGRLMSFEEAAAMGLD
jgi:tetratricopeptide (TPR) repeat protein